jgi:hypothetical protein
MVYIPMTDEELLQQQEQQNMVNQPGEPIVAPSGSDVLSSSAAGTPSQPAPQGTSGGGTGFTNVRQYLEQNKPQGTKLAGQVGNYILGQGDVAKAGIESGQEQFNTQVRQNEINLNQDLYNELMKNPTKLIQDQAKLDEFNREKNASYAGPSSLESTDIYNPLVEANQKALATVKGAGTEEGQQTILNDMLTNKAHFTPGVTNLNQLLLQNPEARDVIGQSVGNVTDWNLDQRLADAAAAAQKRAAEAKTNTETTKQKIGEGLETLYSNLQSGVSAKEAAAKQKALDSINLYKTKFFTPSAAYNPAIPVQDIGSQGRRAPSYDPNIVVQRGSSLPPGMMIKPGMPSSNYLGITNEQLQDLQNRNDFLNQYASRWLPQNPAQGLISGTVNPMYPQWPVGTFGGIDLSQYLSFLNPDVEITKANAASPEDYAKYAALNQLAGDPNQYGRTSNFLPSSYAGAYNPDMVNFDYNSALGQVNSIIDAYEKALATTRQGITVT